MQDERRFAELPSTPAGRRPGLNAVIRAATLSALQRGWEVLGIRRGYTGLLEGEVDGEPGIFPLTAQSVRGITHLGGTILGTTTRGNPFGLEVRKSDGSWGTADRSGEIVDRFAELEIDALIAIGGDGSLSIAHALYQKGLPVIGVPKTIDNDLAATDMTFGFQTAAKWRRTQSEDCTRLPKRISGPCWWRSWGGIPAGLLSSRAWQAGRTLY